MQLRKSINFEFQGRSHLGYFQKRLWNVYPSFSLHSLSPFHSLFLQSNRSFSTTSTTRFPFPLSLTSLRPLLSFTPSPFQKFNLSVFPHPSPSFVLPSSFLSSFSPSNNQKLFEVCRFFFFILWISELFIHFLNLRKKKRKKKEKEKKRKKRKDQRIINDETQRYF